MSLGGLRIPGRGQVLAAVVVLATAAQSDLYSAVTLAGVIETDCIVLAGD
ncbi:hypothetical protein [Candidatus Poriferisodalis sp.]